MAPGNSSIHLLLVVGAELFEYPPSIKAKLIPGFQKK